MSQIRQFIHPKHPVLKGVIEEPITDHQPGGRLCDPDEPVTYP